MSNVICFLISRVIIVKIRRPLPCWQGMTLDWMVLRSFLLAHEVSVHSPRSLKINKNGFKINKK